MSREHFLCTVQVRKRGVDEGGDESLKVEAGLDKECLKSRPGWKALLARDGELRVVQRRGWTTDALEGGGVTGSGSFEQRLCLFAVELEIEASGLGMGRHATSF